MKKFLLLRNNKQSGPYSTEELQQMGLKPYDLIWVEGKSAAWRYPGEVEDLKAFAPAVEEQPYDRFYKKPAEQPAPIETPAASQPLPQQQPVEKPARKKEYKRVFVTLPSNGATQKPAAEPIKTIQYQPPVTEVKEAAQTPPAEELYEQKVYTHPKTAKETQADVYFPKSRRFRGVPLTAMIIGMLAMAAIGIVVGMSLAGNKPFSMIKKVDRVDPAPNNQQPIIPTNQSGNDAAVTDPAAAQTVIDSAVKEPQKQVTKPPVVKKNPAAADTNLQKIAANYPVKQEPEKKEEETQIKKEAPRPSVPDFEKLVSVSNNNFDVGPFGGISRLSLTVKNSSEYDLNLVVVQLDYIKANKEVYKTENLYFRDIAANSTVTLDAPKSSRGNKINYKVTLVNSKDYTFRGN